MSNFMKIRSMGAEMFHTEGQAETDRQDGATAASRNFTNARLKNQTFVWALNEAVFRYEKSIICYALLHFEGHSENKFTLRTIS